MDQATPRDNGHGLTDAGVNFISRVCWRITRPLTSTRARTADVRMSNDAHPQTRFEYFMGHILAGLVAAQYQLKPDDLVERALILAAEADKQYLQRFKILKRAGFKNAEEDAAADDD